MANPAVTHLISLQGPDGGFGPYPGAPARTEATALAALALSASDEAGAAAALSGAVEWLGGARLASGAWPLMPGFSDPHWSTSHAVLALAGVDGATDEALAGAGWLLGVEGSGPVWWARLLYRLFPDRKAVELDTDLSGWPWAVGTFSWVEPTAYALMALKRLRSRLDDSRLDRRLEDGDLLLADRACVGGGWNYGNPRVLGENLWPYPDTTAVALIALGDRPDLPEVEEGLRVMPSLLGENDSILSLSLSALALSTHARDADSILDALEARAESWAGGEIRTLSWAGLALARATDVLGISAASVSSHG